MDSSGLPAAVALPPVVYGPVNVGLLSAEIQTDVAAVPRKFHKNTPWDAFWRYQNQHYNNDQ